MWWPGGRSRFLYKKTIDDYVTLHQTEFLGMEKLLKENRRLYVYHIFFYFHADIWSSLVLATAQILGNVGNSEVRFHYFLIFLNNGKWNKNYIYFDFDQQIRFVKVLCGGARRMGRGLEYVGSRLRPSWRSKMAAPHSTSVSPVSRPSSRQSRPKSK